MITTTMPNAPQPTVDDPELDVADWIDQQTGQKAYEVGSDGSNRSITLK